MTNNSSSINTLHQPDPVTAPRQRLPSWLKRPVAAAGGKPGVERRILDNRLHTVCKEARCPNRTECFSKGTATFLIMGNRCSRSCRFCAIGHGNPVSLDTDEPSRLCAAVRELGLSYIVITSVTRDDLPDGGAAHFAATVREIKQFMPAVRVEVLIPDFQGDSLALRTVLDSNPDVLNHNIETVPRLYPLVRPQAGYQRSLDVLKQSACFTPEVTVKSGLMVGLGEREDEITAVLHDLHAHGCSVVTIGQYLQPSQAQIAVDRFVSPEQFDRYETIGRDMGFQAVFSGPFVRSSYMAAHVFENRNTKFTKLPI